MNSHKMPLFENTLTLFALAESLTADLQVSSAVLCCTPALLYRECVTGVAFQLCVQMSGAVTYTGSSSMEVRMAARFAGFTTPYIVATFTFVARDTRVAAGEHSGAAWRVSKLVPQSDEEKALYAQSELRVAARKAAAKATAAQKAQSDKDDVRSKIGCIDCTVLLLRLDAIQL